MTDDDDTLRQTKRRIQTSDDRALQHRPAKSSPGIPMPEIDDPADTTSPFDLFKPERMERHRRRGDSVVALAQRLREERPDPYDLLAQLAFEHIDAKRASESESKELDKQLKAFLAIQPGGERFEEVAKQVAELAPVRRGLQMLQASLVLVILGIGGWLYARGGKETSIDMKIEALERAVNKLGDLVDQLRHPTPGVGP